MGENVSVVMSFVGGCSGEIVLVGGGTASVAITLEVRSWFDFDLRRLGNELVIFCFDDWRLSCLGGGLRSRKEWDNKDTCLVLRALSESDRHNSSLLISLLGRVR